MKVPHMSHQLNMVWTRF